MWRRAAAIVLLVGAVVVGILALTGSGLSRDERRDVAAAEASIATAGLDRRADEERAAVDRLVEIFRAKPDAEYDGRSMHEVLVDASNALRPYRPRLADRLQSETNGLLWERDRGNGPVDVGQP